MSVLDITLNRWGYSNAGALGNEEHSFIAITPRSTPAGVVAANKALSIGQLNCVLMLNGITWNRTIVIFKLHTYAKLNCLR